MTNICDCSETIGWALCTEHGHLIKTAVLCESPEKLLVKKCGWTNDWLHLLFTLDTDIIIIIINKVKIELQLDFT